MLLKPQASVFSINTDIGEGFNNPYSKYENNFYRKEAYKITRFGYN